ncbi:MAG: hypothetical protein PHG65_12875, partial [Kiritimatiellae bacterium]|nr:hypothetical protein [Kiritimatiellia bacterium]
SFCRRMILEKGAEWALDWAGRLSAENKGILLADFLAVMDSIPEFRALIVTQASGVQARYWEKVNLYKAVFHDPDDFSNTVKAVLNAGRWDQALLMALASLTEKDHLVGKASDYLRILRYPLEKKAGNAMEPDNSLVSLPYVLAKIFLWLDTARGGIKREDLAMLEVYYFDFLNHSERKPHHIWQQMADNPTFFAQLVSMMFWTASDSRPYEEIPESEKEQYKKQAEVAFKLLHNWKGYPGEGKTAEERDILLRKWCDEVLERTKQNECEAVGQVRVGEVLARVRVSADEGDGVWPCRVAREYIDERGYEAVARGIATGRFNSIGMISFTMDKAGQSEREWALAYQDAASKIRDDYPKTARMLENMAEKYQFFAEHDVRDMEKYTDP